MKNVLLLLSWVLAFALPAFANNNGTTTESTTAKNPAIVRTTGEHNSDCALDCSDDTLCPPARRERTSLDGERNGIEQDEIESEEYNWQILRSPLTNSIPSGMHARELNFAKQLPQREQSAVSVQSAAWAANGPQNIGGRTRALAIDVNDNYLIAGGVSGGMWRSTDDGSTWTNTTPGNVIQSVTCVAQDARTGKDNNWYYGTGEFAGNSANATGARYYGDGIFKSTDYGASWNVLPSTTTGEQTSLANPFQYVYSIVTDPSNTTEDVVYAATPGGVERSSDGGATWTMTLGTFTAGPLFTDVAITSTGVVYAACGIAGNGVVDAATYGIFRSTDGMHWTNITPTSGWPSFTAQISIGIAPSDESIVYFLMYTSLQGYDGPGNDEFWKYRYQSGDGTGTGGSWVNRSANIPQNAAYGSPDYAYVSQQNYDIYVRVLPNDTNTIFFGGVELYVSTDGLATNSGRIVSYDNQGNQTIHVDQHAMVFESGNHASLYVGNDGGVYEGLYNPGDHTVEWNSLDNAYLTTQFYTVAIDHNTPGSNVLIGGMQDNATAFLNSQAAIQPWSSVFIGDGSFCGVSVFNNAPAYYVSAQNSYVWREAIDNSGSVTTQSQTRIDPSGGGDYLFISPFALDPNNRDIMYLAGGNGGNSGIWRNSNLSQIPIGNQDTAAPTLNWQFLANTILASGKVSAFGISTTPANRVYYGTTAGNVYRLDNAQSGDPTPINVTPATQNGNVGCVAVDPANGDNAIVVITNYGVQSLFYTTNAGANWSAVGGNLEQFSDGSGDGPSCRWAAIVHVGGGTIYLVGTEVGLYSTSFLNEAATVWEQESPADIGYAICTMIDARQSDGRTAVATHGAGVFTTDYTASDIPQLPQSPTLVAPVSGSSNVSTNVILQWLPVQGGNYHLQVYTDPSAPAYIADQDVLTANTNLSGSNIITDTVHGLAANTTYYWRVLAEGPGGESQYSAAWQFTTGAAAVNENGNEPTSAPASFTLQQNAPNPFSSSTDIPYTIDNSGAINLAVFDMLGSRIATLANGYMPSGAYSVHWDASAYSAGVYFYRLTSAHSVETKKLTLVK